jgi:hypothetical protein
MKLISFLSQSSRWWIVVVERCGDCRHHCTPDLEVRVRSRGEGVEAQIRSLYRWGGTTKIQTETLMVGLGSVLMMMLLYIVVAWVRVRVSYLIRYRYGDTLILKNLRYRCGYI